MMDVRVYQTFHKDFPCRTDAGWLQPVGVGGYRRVGFLSDAEGEHIAHLNPYYCELTVQYWAWKNTRSTHVGFCHYRRYMNFMPDNSWAGSGNASVSADQAMVDYLCSAQQHERLQRLLGTWDAVVPRALPTMPSVAQQYLNCVKAEPWQEFVRCVRLMYAGHPGVERWFDLAAATPMWNMFVMRRDLFETYCHELFTLLDAVYGRIGAPYGDYDNRYPGFLAERFLGMWLHVHRVRHLDVPVLVLN